MVSSVMLWEVKGEKDVNHLSEHGASLTLLLQSQPSGTRHARPALSHLTPSGKPCPGLSLALGHHGYLKNQTGTAANSEKEWGAIHREKGAVEDTSHREDENTQKN